MELAPTGIGFEPQFRLGYSPRLFISHEQKMTIDHQINQSINYSVIDNTMENYSEENVAVCFYFKIFSEIYMHLLLDFYIWKKKQ